MNNYKIKNRLFIVMIFMFSLSVITIGCKKETTEEPNYSNQEIDLIGLRHNEGLDVILGAFEKSSIAEEYRNKKSANIALTTQDKLEIARFLDVQAKTFISNNPVTYKGEQIDVEPVQFSDEQLLSFYNSEINGNLSTELQLKYFTLLEDAHYSHPGSDISLVREIDHILSDAKAEITDEGELVPVLTMGSVLKFSNHYWHSDRKSKGWVSIALADASNGGSAALWGAAVAGPLGAVVVGLNGAIIGSCTAYLISEI